MDFSRFKRLEKIVFVKCQGFSFDCNGLDLSQCEGLKCIKFIECKGLDKVNIKIKSILRFQIGCRVVVR